MKELYNLFLFIIICFVIYLVFRNFHYKPVIMEGMTDTSGNTNIPMPPNGIAGNSSAYSAALKSNVINLEDTFLISNYRSNYESIILSYDDLINSKMLQVILTTNPNNPDNSFDKLATMQQARSALNSVMKFVDGK